MKIINIPSSNVKHANQQYMLQVEININCVNTNLTFQYGIVAQK